MLSCTVHTTYAVALKTTTHPKTWCRKPYAATQHLILLMMGVCTRNMSMSGQNSVLILLASGQQTCMTYTIAVCTVKNS